MPLRVLWRSSGPHFCFEIWLRLLHGWHVMRMRTSRVRCCMCRGSFPCTAHCTFFANGASSSRSSCLLRAAMLLAPALPSVTLYPGFFIVISRSFFPLLPVVFVFSYCYPVYIPCTHCHNIASIPISFRSASFVCAEGQSHLFSIL